MSRRSVRLLGCATLVGGLIVAFRLGGEARAGFIPGGGNPRSDCFVEFDVAGVTDESNHVVCTDGDPCDADGECDGVCTFRVRLCVNQTNMPECRPTGLRKAPRASFPLLSPTTLNGGAACGPFADIRLPVKKRQGKDDPRIIAGRKRLMARALSTSKPKQDRDILFLTCLPREDSCGTTLSTTTTTIGAATTTTPVSATSTTAIHVSTTTTTRPSGPSTRIDPIRCCVQSSPAGAFSTCIDVTAEQCAAQHGINLGAGSCPATHTASLRGGVNVNPCPPSTTTSTRSTTTTEAQSSTTSTTTAGTTTTTTFGGPCDCCAQLPSLLSFTTAATGCETNPPGTLAPAQCVPCGVGCTPMTCTQDADCFGFVCRGHLDCAGLYYGGGVSAPDLPQRFPADALVYSKVASCTAGNPDLAPTTPADVPGPGCPTPPGTPTYGQRHCTSPGCLFGAPLAIPDPTAGTCIVSIVADQPDAGSGTAECRTGAVNNLSLPLDSQVYLTGTVEPCSVCAGGALGVCGSGTCRGGPRDGLPCTPETSATGGGYPTSHDCPPPGSPGGQLAAGCRAVPGSSFIGCLSIDLALTTGTQTKTSFSTAAQQHVFCGYCASPTAFANPPAPCTSDADCAARGDNFTLCRQHSSGAFRNPGAASITETGASPNACLADGAGHAATLGSVFCVPPSFNAIIDAAGELPGPGAISIPSTLQFTP